MRSKTTLGLVGVFGMLFLVYAPRFAAQGNPVVITAAAPNLSRTTLFVNGRNFAGSASVSLAEMVLSGVVVDATGTIITAQLPPGISPGSYLLEVSNGSAFGETAAFAVTLGETPDLGNSNTAAGVNVLRSLTTGGNNTAMGWQALENNSTGNGNIAVGANAGANVTTGDNNIHIGHPGMVGDTNIIRIGDGETQTDTYLTGIIHGDGSGLTGIARFETATGNFGIGTTTPGFRLDVVGTNTLADRTIGINGTPMVYLPDQSPFFSSLAFGNGLRNLSHATEEQGRYNTAVGVDALLANTTGYFNTAIGSLAMSNNTTGVYSVAVGQGALHSNTTGVNNTAVGVSALYSNTTANYNTAIGLDALQYNSTGTENTSVGKRSNWQNTTGSFNTSIGTDSLFNNLTGGSNTALGHNALYANLASNNVAVGASALVANRTGTDNAAVGRAALLNNERGNNNTAIGNLAGRYQADAVTALTASTNSVYVGYNAMGLNNSDSNSIVVGASAKGIGANTVVLGNDSVVTTALKGRVGVGTTVPGEKLSVNGRLLVGDALWSAGTVTNGDVAIKGNVGIGTNAPALRLDVNGATGYPRTSGTDQTGVVRFEAANDNVLDIGQGNSGTYGLWLQGTNRLNLAVNYPLLLNPVGGNVGIGTAVPSSRLEVNGTVDARAYRVGGGAGVSCSGLPTAGFRVVNGIVTGC